MEFCPINCMSVKNKHSLAQCPNKRKVGSEYCGVHTRCKKVIRIDKISQLSQPVSSGKIKKKVLSTGSVLLSQDEILEMLRNNSDSSTLSEETKGNVEYTRKYFNVKKMGDNIAILLKIFDVYSRIKYCGEKLIPWVIKIQSYIRKWRIYRRRKVNNPEDFATLESIYNIPPEYYIQYKEGEFVYGFDYRSLNSLFENTNGKVQNPFSLQDFDMDQLNPILLKTKQLLENKKMKQVYDTPELSVEQKFTQLLVKVFQTFDLLGQYTDTAWFSSLDLNQLKTLYKSAEDMFNYRAELPLQMKKKIVKTGVAFNKLLNELPYLQEKHKRFLQEEILNEFYRFATEGFDDETKKLGTNLMLTSIVEVSMEAAIALPHLVQSTF
jgi:hypothetical protein